MKVATVLLPMLCCLFLRADRVGEPKPLHSTSIPNICSTGRTRGDLHCLEGTRVWQLRVLFFDRFPHDKEALKTCLAYLNWAKTRYRGHDFLVYPQVATEPDEEGDRMFVDLFPWGDRNKRLTYLEKGGNTFLMDSR